MDLFFMLVIAIFAVFFDLKTGKIPNGLILTGFAIGICYQTALHEYLGILMFFGGSGLPVILLWILFYFRMLGAGDIKILAVMGGFLGPSKSFYCVLAAILAGGIMALVIVLLRRNLTERIRCFAQYTKQYLNTGEWKPYDEQDLKGGTFCFSIPILISIILYAGGVY